MYGIEGLALLISHRNTQQETYLSILRLQLEGEWDWGAVFFEPFFASPRLKVVPFLHRWTQNTIEYLI